MSTDKSIEEKMRASVEIMRGKFLHSLPKRMDEIRVGWENARNSPDNAALQKEYYRLVHSMAGSAGTFGFDDLSTQARRMLQMIKNWQENREPIDVVLRDIETEMREFESLAVVTQQLEHD